MFVVFKLTQYPTSQHLTLEFESSFHQLSLRETRNVRSSRPSRPVLRMPSAFMKPPVLMLLVGLEWCGVFATLKDSARNFSSDCSPNRHFRSTPISRLISPGPVSVLAPQVPKRPAAGTLKSDRSYH